MNLSKFVAQFEFLVEGLPDLDSIRNDKNTRMRRRADRTSAEKVRGSQAAGKKAKMKFGRSIYRDARDRVDSDRIKAGRK